MLEEIIMKEKEIQQDTIDRLLNLNKVFTGNEAGVEKEEKNVCLMDVASTNLRKAELIHDVIINISGVIQGGR